MIYTYSDVSYKHCISLHLRFFTFLLYNSSHFSHHISPITFNPSHLTSTSLPVFGSSVFRFPFSAVFRSCFPPVLVWFWCWFSSCYTQSALIILPSILDIMTSICYIKCIFYGIIWKDMEGYTHRHMKDMENQLNRAELGIWKRIWKDTEDTESYLEDMRSFGS